VKPLWRGCLQRLHRGPQRVGLCGTLWSLCGKGVRRGFTEVHRGSASVGLCGASVAEVHRGSPTEGHPLWVSVDLCGHLDSQCSGFLKFQSNGYKGTQWCPVTLKNMYMQGNVLKIRITHAQRPTCEYPSHSDPLWEPQISVRRGGFL